MNLVERLRKQVVILIEFWGGDLDDPDQEGLRLHVESANEIERLMRPGTCVTCHWWFSRGRSQCDRHLCVLHNGLNAAPRVENRKLAFGGRELRTVSEFGCLCWEEDKREATIDQQRTENTDDALRQSTAGALRDRHQPASPDIRAGLQAAADAFRDDSPNTND